MNDLKLEEREVLAYLKKFLNTLFPPDDEGGCDLFKASDFATAFVEGVSWKALRLFYKKRGQWCSITLKKEGVTK